jgi:hypothetical protein
MNHQQESAAVIFARLLRATFISILALTASAPVTSGKTDDPDRTPLPSAASMIGPEISKIEDDISQLEQKRDAIPPATAAWLDLQIDSRICARWLLAQTAGSKERSAEQVAGYLHSASMLSVIPVVDDFSSKQTAGPNQVQAVGTGRIHQLTYHLNDAKDIAAFDDASAELAQDILIAITPMQGGDRLPALVRMRPAPLATSEPSESGGIATSGSTTVDELASMARQASVSGPLRHQLLAMAALAQQAQADPNQAQEAQTLKAELESALNLSAGLQANMAVTPDERGQIENQLCDGLALFSDPRMRSVGIARLGALDDYRDLLGRVEKMRVPPELKQALAPALAWAHQNPDKGDKVLNAVEKFVALYVRQQARPLDPQEFTGLRTGDPLRRAYDELGKQFVKIRGDFLGDVADLGTSPSAGRSNGEQRNDGIMNTGGGPDSLIRPVSEMSQIEQLLDVVVGMPKTYQTLDAFRPRPVGGIQRHVNILLNVIESPIKSPARDEADQQLISLHKLAMFAGELTDQGGASVPPAVAQAYSGDQIQALETKWKAIVLELAESFAANEPMDQGKLDRLRSVHGLFDALGPAAAFEAAFAKPEGLAKWADWTITPDQVHALFTPYQQALSQAFGGVIADNPDATAAFSRLRPHYEALMALFARTGSYADACAQLPDGTVGLLSRLGTPYKKAPFADQRFASFIAALSAAANGDSSITDSAVIAISDHLHR